MNYTLEQKAQWIVDNEILTLSNWVYRALSSSDHDWADAGYTWEEVENLYNDEGCTREVMQWFEVTSNLCHDLKKLGYVVLETEDGYFWGRCGYGYALSTDMEEVVELREAEHQEFFAKLKA